MEQITLEDIKSYEDENLSIEELAEKIASDFGISAEEAETQISELMKKYTGESRHED